MKVHFSGVGGIGMSALARYFLSKANIVSGSDSSMSDLTNDLISEGMKWIDHKEEFDSDIDLHVYSEAVPAEDLQRKQASKIGLKSISYFQALGEISNNYFTIAVSGSHGKSTVTSMIGIAACQAGLDPLVIVGTKVREFDGKNIHFPQNNEKYFVVEACEYRENFLGLSPDIMVLLNCEHDHHDYFKTEEEYLNAYRKLAEKTAKIIVANGEDENVVKLLKGLESKTMFLNFSEITYPLNPQVPGTHNRFNAEIASLTISKLTDEKQLEIARKSLENFSGTWRRFERLGKFNNLECIDDYAHHPSEIEATLDSLAKTAAGKKRIVLYQAHQYSRTRHLFAETIESFMKNPPELILLTDIYEARDSEEDKEAVSAQKLANYLKDKGLNAVYTGDYQKTEQYLQSVYQDYDYLLSMGAGPVYQVLLKLINS